MSLVIPPPETSGSQDNVTTGATMRVEDTGSMSIGSGAASFPPVDLPHELLIEIFNFACLARGGEANAVNPLFLAKICRSWRAVLFKIRAFWQEVNLILNSHYSTQISLLEEWTARAGGLPLSISIVDPKSILNTLLPEEELTHLLDLIRILSPQAHSLSLEIPVIFYDRWRDCGLADYSWPLLSNLALSTTLGSSALSDPSHKLDFLTCPILTTTTIKSLFHSHVCLPWRSLLHIRFDSVLCSELYGALESCPLLQTLEAVSINEDDDFRARTIDLRSLKRLTFELEDQQNDCQACCRLLNLLRPPALRTLVLKLAKSAPFKGFEFDIYPCISQSGCQLSELTVEGASLEETVLIDCLRLLPSLRTLRLSENTWFNAEGDFTPLGPTSLSLMIAASPNGLLMLPNLRALTFAGSDAEFSAELVVEVLASRWDNLGDDFGAHATLQAVTIIPERGDASLWEVDKDQQAIFENWRRREYSVRVE
ncbi:hypothetical protein DFP72DRAFT_405541 [Ephemerocybe angulata]|uniref:F-box domain-containing protein n=1 Tax=Ephemerocybe angulata TaxID=980116 RepID=A0A8H6HUC2_9AGAR|nr:hypothetical protein DFP72DRAFT_405541 [Tulosesus angulatus]